MDSSSAPPAQKAPVVAVRPPANKFMQEKIPDDFSLEAATATLRPEDIISEDKHKKEKGVFVGERDDSIPPEYRFNEEESKKRPAPKPEPSINTGDALDFLSGDFAFSSSAPVVQAPVITPSAPPAQLAAGADNALDALDALSDTLKDITPVPMPAPVPTKDLVNEEKLKEERLIKMGERDDTWPPEYRPTGKSMDDKTALDLLSSDFSAAASLAVAPVASDTATTKLEPPVLDSEPLKVAREIHCYL
nr:calpastatin-like [Pseudochaenichthys georgianus]